MEKYKRKYAVANFVGLVWRHYMRSGFAAQKYFAKSNTKFRDDPDSPPYEQAILGSYRNQMI
jgi:hypothetical protein